MYPLNTSSTWIQTILQNHTAYWIATLTMWRLSILEPCSIPTLYIISHTLFWCRRVYTWLCIVTWSICYICFCLIPLTLFIGSINLFNTWPSKTFIKNSHKLVWCVSSCDIRRIFYLYCTMAFRTEDFLCMLSQ